MPGMPPGRLHPGDDGGHLQEARGYGRERRPARRRAGRHGRAVRGGEGPLGGRGRVRRRPFDGRGQGRLRVRGNLWGRRPERLRLRVFRQKLRRHAMRRLPAPPWRGMQRRDGDGHPSKAPRAHAPRRGRGGDEAAGRHRRRLQAHGRRLPRRPDHRRRLGDNDGPLRVPHREAGQLGEAHRGGDRGRFRRGRPHSQGKEARQRRRGTDGGGCGWHAMGSGALWRRG